MRNLHDKVTKILGENSASSMSIFLVSTTTGENMDALKTHLQVPIPLILVFFPESS